MYERKMKICDFWYDSKKKKKKKKFSSTFSITYQILQQK